MIDGKKIDQFKNLFESSSSILIICAGDVLKDQLQAAASLFENLRLNSKKNVKLLSSRDLSNVYEDVDFLEDLQTEIGHENLCISLDYQEDAVDKVSYHISQEVKKFFLTIKPKKGSAPLDTDNVEFFYTGAEADMIILVGVDELASLGTLYAGYENLFNSTALVSINSYETDFGNLKIDVSGASCFSEFVAQLLKNFDIPIDSGVATSLLSEINEETAGFSSQSATADTFETISVLLRAGARRIRAKKPKQAEQVEQVERAEQVSPVKKASKTKSKKKLVKKLIKN